MSADGPLVNGYEWTVNRGQGRSARYESLRGGNKRIATICMARSSGPQEQLASFVTEVGDGVVYLGAERRLCFRMNASLLIKTGFLMTSPSSVMALANWDTGWSTNQTCSISGLSEL